MKRFLNFGHVNMWATGALMMAILWMSPAVQAAALIFDDTNPNETITVSANDFEFGLDINGVLFQQGLNNPASAVFPESAGAISFDGSWNTAGSLANGVISGIVYFVEDSNPTVISDILEYTVETQISSIFSISRIRGHFISDDHNNLGTLPPGVGAVVEDGQLYTVPGLPFLTLGVLSDAEQVPEPASVITWSLLGLCSLGFGRRALRRAA